MCGLETERLARQPFERFRLSRRGPQLELRVTRRADLQQVVVAAVVKRKTADRLRVAPVEILRQPQHRRQRADDAPFLAAQPAELGVLALRRRLPMVPRHERDDVDFLRLEAAQIPVAN